MTETAKRATKPRKVKSALEKLLDAVEAARKDGYTVSGRADRLNDDGVSEGVNL